MATMADRSYIERNAAARARIAELLRFFGEEDFLRDAAGGWTIGALFAHVAHWDRFVAARWRHAQASGATTPLYLADEIVALVNEAGLPIWRAIQPTRVESIVLSATQDVDDLVAALSDEAVLAVADEGRPQLLDRSPHRLEHLGAIAAATGRRTP